MRYYWHLWFPSCGHFVVLWVLVQRENGEIELSGLLWDRELEKSGPEDLNITKLESREDIFRTLSV